MSLEQKSQKIQTEIDINEYPIIIFDLDYIKRKNINLGFFRSLSRNYAALK